MEHVRSLLFQDFGALRSKTLMDYTFYLATGFGHEAVVLFFVISGFLVGGKVWERWTRGSFQWPRYLIDRASRLYAVLVFALLLGAALDFAGSRWFDQSGYYTLQTSQPVATLAYDVTSRLDVPHLLGSLFMVQEVLIPSFGSNGPLWSLAHEWWYYLLFPLVLELFRGGIFRRLVAFLVISLIGGLLTSYVVVLFGVWLLGVLAWRVNRRSLLPVWVSLPLCLAALLAMRLEIRLFPFAHQYLVGAGFALLLNSLVARNSSLPFKRLSQNFADFSYSLYLVHFPLILLIVSAAFSTGWLRDRTALNGQSFALFVAIVSTTVIVSYLVSRFTEARTATLRDALYRLFRVADSRPRSPQPDT